MKIKVKNLSYDEVLNIKKEKHILPKHQSRLARTILKLASSGEINAVDFTYKEIDMDKLPPSEPALFLMNHSSFTDLMIASKMLYNRQYHIITTNDGFIGKEGLMRFIGCIPTRKFINDMALIKDMKYTFNELKSSILMFPEASYSFDGSTTPLPDSLGKFVKVMGIPVVIIKTKGAYLRDPLYNNLQKRKSNVSATMTLRLSKDDIKKMSAGEIGKVIADDFKYDHFRQQVEDGVKITESFRADGLHRPLYKCPHCQNEGKMVGKGITISCQACGLNAQLTEEGKLSFDNSVILSDNSSSLADTKTGSLITNIPTPKQFEYITDWYAWERECVKQELIDGTYNMTLDVDILMLADLKSMYRVGSGTLVHSNEGFSLTGCDGKLNYTQTPKSSYSLYSDYFWYEIGDMISIGDNNYQYYCFPKDQKSAIVAKARLAAEELYKLSTK